MKNKKKINKKEKLEDAGEESERASEVQYEVKQKRHTSHTQY